MSTVGGEILHGVSPLGSQVLQRVAGDGLDRLRVAMAGLNQGRRVRLATLLGPLVVMGWVTGQAVVNVGGPLSLLGGFCGLTGIGYGLGTPTSNSYHVCGPSGEEDVPRPGYSWATSWGPPSARPSWVSWRTRRAWRRVWSGDGSRGGHVGVRGKYRGAGGFALLTSGSC